MAKCQPHFARGFTGHGLLDLSERVMIVSRKTATRNNGTVTLPNKVLEAMFDASNKLIKAQDELEDYLFMSNPKFVAKLRQSHKQALAGKGSAKDWQSLGRL